MNERLYFLLSSAQYQLRSFVDEQAVARTGLTSAQMGLLFFVAQREGCSLKEVARGLQVKSSAVTGLVTRTEKTGCIRRRASADDGRASQLFLTPKGRRKLEEVRKLNRELDDLLREGFDQDEIALVGRFLHHVLTIPRRA